MKKIHIESFRPIEKGNIDISDLTLLIGAPASGKGLFLQLLKLLIDKDHIRETIEQYGYIWGEDVTVLK